MSARARLPGTNADHPVKRQYLARLQTAENRYHARMTKVRCALKAQRQLANKLKRWGRAEDAGAVMTRALSAFERARRRAEAGRDRLRRRAAVWLRRQNEPLAYRQKFAPSVVKYRAQIGIASL